MRKRKPTLTERLAAMPYEEQLNLAIQYAMKISLIQPPERNTAGYFLKLALRDPINNLNSDTVIKYALFELEGREERRKMRRTGGHPFFRR